MRQRFVRTLQALPWVRQSLPAPEVKELIDLMGLEWALMPVVPDAEFRVRLGCQLAVAAGERQPEPSRSVRWRPGSRAIGLAATASVVSLTVGVITIVALIRARAGATPTASGTIV